MSSGPCDNCGYYLDGRRGDWPSEWDYCPKCGQEADSDE